MSGSCLCRPKGPLPDLENSSGYSLPEEFRGSQKGTDGKYQCENDPRFAGTCFWDGLNCVPYQPQPRPAILNST
eukprot:2758500-Amphidinium_carterae.1